MTNSVVWKKWWGKNLASKSNSINRTGSSNYKIHRAAKAHSIKSIITSPALQNSIFFYFQSAAGLKNHTFSKVTDLNPNQNNNTRKKGKHHTRFMREKIIWHFYMQMMNISRKEFNMIDVLCFPSAIKWAPVMHLPTLALYFHRKVHKLSHANWQQLYRGHGAQGHDWLTHQLKVTDGSFSYHWGQWKRRKTLLGFWGVLWGLCLIDLCFICFCFFHF